MKVNKKTLADAFERCWEVTVEPSDFPDELNTIISYINYRVEGKDDIRDLNQIEQSIFEGNEHLFLTKMDLERNKQLHHCREELYVIMENLKNANFPNEDIKDIFNDVIKDI